MPVGLLLRNWNLPGLRLSLTLDAEVVAKTSKSHSPPHIGASPGSQEAWTPPLGQSGLCLRTSQKKTQEAPHQDDAKDSSEQLQDMGAPHLSLRGQDWTTQHFCF